MVEELEDSNKPSGCVGAGETSCSSAVAASLTRKDRRKVLKKEKRKQKRKEVAEKVRQEEVALLNDPDEQRRIEMEEAREKERMERERREFEEREQMFLEELERRKAQQEEEEARRLARENEEKESKQNMVGRENEVNEEDDWVYVEEGPPEIIWQGNEIIVKKRTVRMKKKDADQQSVEEDPNRPTSNPLPPQSEAFSEFKSASKGSAQQLLDDVAQQIPNFGTEQDKAHCPFHLKTGACRFGTRCSRVHFYPDKSCTLLIKNMYNGPGLAWEQDEGLEHTDEEVERCYEEFYEDVHTEFLKFGEIINFKVCRNSSFHLRGNVYVHYKHLDSAVLAYSSINGRFFAGKQITCEFVNITRWKVAICGEYMKSKLQTCSRGTACNFIHCFRNPGGDYEWADWDKPPPRYWIKKMDALFGHMDESYYEGQVVEDNSVPHKDASKTTSTDSYRYHSRRSQAKEVDFSKRSSKSYHEEQEIHDSRRTAHQRQHSSKNRKRRGFYHEKQYEKEASARHYPHITDRFHDSESDKDQVEKDDDRDWHHGDTRRRSRSPAVKRKYRSCEGGNKRRHDTDLYDVSQDPIKNERSGHSRKRPRQAADDFKESQSRQRAVSSREQSGKDRSKDIHLRGKRSARHRGEATVLVDDRWGGGSRSHGSEHTGDWSDEEVANDCYDKHSTVASSSSDGVESPNAGAQGVGGHSTP